MLLQTPEMNIDRVRARVLHGGHDVAENKIVERYWRSLAQLPWFLEMADLAEIFDNSGAEPKLVARKVASQVVVSPTAPINLLNAINALDP